MARRVVHLALGAAYREIRRELRMDATWADAHLASTDNIRRAKITVDSSVGFDETRHPSQGPSPRPATTIFVEIA